MNWGSVALGAVMIGYGIWTGFQRPRAPEKFEKLQAMKEFYGAKRGTIIHVIGYTVLPIIFGIVFLVAGIRDAPLFGG